MPSLKIDTATLMDAASYLVSTASERHSLPVLSMFMISIKGNSARFISSSTEREVTFTCEVDPNDCQDGTLVVPGKKLHDLVKNAPKESVATLKENIDKNKSIVLGNNETNHGEIHATVLQQTTDFVENTGNRYVNLDGLSNNIMGNSAIQNSSKMILGEFLDNFIVNSSTNCNKILIWNHFLELARAIFYNKIKERMSNKIDLMEERFAKNIQEVEKED